MSVCAEESPRTVAPREKTIPITWRHAIWWGALSIGFICLVAGVLVILFADTGREYYYSYRESQGIVSAGAASTVLLIVVHGCVCLWARNVALLLVLPLPTTIGIGIFMKADLLWPMDLGPLIVATGSLWLMTSFHAFYGNKFLVRFPRGPDQ